MEHGSSKIVAGKRAVEETLRHNRDKVIELILAPGIELAPELTRGVPCQILPKEEFDRLFPDIRHQGVMVKVSEMKEVTLAELLARARELGDRALIVALDQVSDPQNLGSILRVAECAGACGVIIPERKSAPISPVVRKVSAGASEILPIVRVTNLRRALDACKEAGLWIAGASCEESVAVIYEAKIPTPSVLVLGSEGEGMRALTEKECDVLVRLPMFGKLSSLNVAQAASIILYEIRRRMEGH